MPKPLKTFIIYAREDAVFKNELLRQLAPFAQTGLLEKWDDSHILPGEEWEKSIEKALEASQVVLMLVSADSLFSDFIQRKELKKALEQKREGSTRVIPILVRDCLYDMAEGVSELQMLPLHPTSRSLVPVDDLATWGSRASAWAAALRQLREVIADVHARIEAEEKALLEEAEKMAALAAEAEKAKQALAEEAQRAAEALAAEEEARIQREKEAQARAERMRIKDEAAWKAAVELDTLEAYEDYLEKGYTLHEVEAHERIGRLEEAEAKRRAAQKAEEKRKKEEAEKKRLAEEIARKKREQEAAEKKRKEEEVKKNDLFHGIMVHIKGGTFDMGSNDYDQSKPIHNVTVPDFYLCKYPVTQAQWEAIMGDNPSYIKGDDLPVEKVSWNDAQAFIKKLNEKTGKKYRLPSEAEWEYAARGGNQSEGYKYAGSNDLKEVGWYSGNADSTTHPVGQKKANELGLHDMSGNVWEWCQDAWHDSYKGAPDDGSAWLDASGSTAVLRGGSWYYFDAVDYCRVVRRNRYVRNYVNVNIGFRLARTASKGEE